MGGDSPERIDAAKGAERFRADRVLPSNSLNEIEDVADRRHNRAKDRVVTFMAIGVIALIALTCAVALIASLWRGAEAPEWALQLLTHVLIASLAFVMGYQR